MAISKTLSEAMAIKLAVDEDGDVSDLPREKELVLKPGARLKPVKVEGGA
jgi:hypothetical protein